MIVTRFLNTGNFLDRTFKALEEKEAANNLMLGVCLRLQHFPENIETPPYLITVEDGRGLVMAAVMTPPHKLIVHGDRPNLADASRTVVQDLVARRWSVPGVQGPAEPASVFARTWAEITGEEYEETKRQRILKLAEVFSPTSPNGRLRVAAERDIELLTRWIHAFFKETCKRGGDLMIAYKLAKRMIGEGNIFVWEDGKPVSMAAKIRPTPHGVTVSYVYTPPLYRRKGYATACLAGLSQLLLQLGWKFCTLYTDLSNPTFNRIFEKIGFEPAGDFGEFTFHSG